RDLTQLRNFAAGSSIFHFFDAPWVPLYILVIYAVHPVMGMVALFGAVVLFAMALANDLATRKPLNEANGRAINQMKNAESTVRNAEVVEAMGMLDNLVGRWDSENREILAIQETASRKAGSIGAFTKFFRLAVQLGILGIGVYLALGQHITPGAMIAGSIILGRALAPIEQMIGSWRSFIGARESYDRLNKILHRDLSEVRGDMTFPAPQGRLTAEAVTFGMRGSPKPILRGVSFALEPGEALGLIGPSAAGKSTLARLLCGVWMPTAGKVRLDNVDVFHWNRRDFGQHMGYLPQDIELFAGTIRENIARMGEATDEQVIDAAVKANAHDLILRLPEGYDSKIGPGGLGLSGGQRQRIGLARALFGNPKLLILDEPNSNLDSEGEAALMDALKSARDQGVTIVIIAHRPSVLAFVDKMLVLRDGMVEMFGDRNEVMAKLTRAVPTTAAPNAPGAPGAPPAVTGGSADPSTAASQAGDGKVIGGNS
ncbi:MAG: type I secretion system permease/ATPase, partial [Pseudomonadota bacterium]